MAHANQYTRSKPKPKAGHKKRRMCLANGIPEHYFDSSDVGERFCKLCRERMHANPSGEHTWEWPFPWRLV
jgi:hypothetical protein